MKNMLAISLVFLLFGCSNSSLSPENYVQWVTEPANGLLKSKLINDLEVRVLFKPLEYIIAKEFSSNDINTQEFDKRSSELKDMQYYECRISVKNGGQSSNILNYKASTVEDVSKRQYYFSYGFQNDIKLVENGDTLPCKMYHFERAYDLAKHRTFLLAFENSTPSENSDKTLVIDSDALGTGPLKLKFQEEDINNRPTLKLSE